MSHPPNLPSPSHPVRILPPWRSAHGVRKRCWWRARARSRCCTKPAWRAPCPGTAKSPGVGGGPVPVNGAATAECFPVACTTSVAMSLSARPAEGSSWAAIAAMTRTSLTRRTKTTKAIGSWPVSPRRCRWARHRRWRVDVRAGPRVVNGSSDRISGEYAWRVRPPGTRTLNPRIPWDYLGLRRPRSPELHFCLDRCGCGASRGCLGRLFCGGDLW